MSVKIIDVNIEDKFSNEISAVVRVKVKKIWRLKLKLAFWLLGISSWLVGWKIELVDKTCSFGSPYCPCQDGDECHYKGENPMTDYTYRNSL